MELEIVDKKTLTSIIGCVQYESAMKYSSQQKYKEALELNLKASKNGNTNATHALGLAYYNGYGVERDYKEGVKLWREAADEGHLDSMNMLGRAHQYGRGVGRNDKKAIELWMTALLTL
jgi:TPR repeat protein